MASAPAAHQRREEATIPSIRNRTQPSSQVTIKDLARRLGISHQAVSMALRDVPGAVSDETSRRVKALARELGYRANSSAQAIRQHSFETIGYVELMRSLGADYFELAPYSAGICSGATRHDRHVSLVQLPAPLDVRQLSVQKLMRQAHVDGLIVKDTHWLSSGARRFLDNSGPTVFINEKRRYNCVYCDEILGARMMTEELLRRGCRAITYAYIDYHKPASIQHFSEQARIDGYTEALREANLKPDVRPLPYISTNSLPLEESTLKWLSSAKRPDAIFCDGDVVAAALVRYLFAAKLRVADDVVLAGYNDDIVGRHLIVPYLTVHIPAFEMGNTAVDMLVSLIDSPRAAKLPALVVPPTIAEYA